MRFVTRGIRTVSLESIWQDARAAVRTMAKRRGSTSLAIVTLALGISVNAATLAVAYGILVRPLPYANASRLVILNLLFADGGDLGFSRDTLQEYLTRLRTVEAAAGYRTTEATVRAGNRTTVLPAAVVTDSFFDVLGTAAEVGRPRWQAGSSDLVVSGRALDRLLPTGTAESIGTPVSVGGNGYTLTAVMPSGFAFPGDEVAIWLPSPAFVQGTPTGGFSKIVARLRSGVTLEQFRQDADRVRLELNPRSQERVAAFALGDSLVTSLRQILLAAVAGALLVLLVACANVATLFIGRDVAREREFAARLALGATRRRLVQALFVEASLLALIASVCGYAIGAAALRLFVTEAAGTMAGLHRVEMGLPIALATGGLTVVVILLCAFASAWHLTRNDSTPLLRSTSGRYSHGWRARRALVVAQIALSCVLLIGAGLLVRTVSVLMHQDHGFQPAGALEAKVVLSDTMLVDGATSTNFVRGLLDRVRGFPGVRYAGFGSNLPPRTPPLTIAIRMIGRDRDDTRFMKVGTATPGYLPALGVRFLAGRDFEDADARAEAAPVILSESAARFYFQNEDPIGRSIATLPVIFGITGKPRVIAVVSDITYEGLDAPAGSALYLPWSRRPLGRGYLIVRTTDDPMRFAGAIRQAAQQLDPGVPLPELQSLESAMAQSVANRRVRALPAVGFGVLAVVLALIGVLATMSTFVAERRRELAIQSALGASPARLIGAVAGQGLELTAAGLVVGVGLGAAAAKSLSSLLYGVGPYDVATFAGTALLIGVGATVTAYLAAARAGSIDPLVALKSD